MATTFFGKFYRTLMSTTDENIEKVSTLVRKDRRLSIYAIAEIVGIDKESVQQILHDHLEM